eukprot:TRINITY_DN7855_c0_g1_i4.p1 TRINITY_DN7855_c0_g1~~TRINITY_DN7855_c0_g1_i4.p1  ORF type:complete len:293 (-),score=41.76 TRINITY_DN7855_c0_g1_i4:137-1015(-)
MWETKLAQSGAIGVSVDQIQNAEYSLEYPSGGFLPDHNFPHMLPSLPPLPNLSNLPNLPPSNLSALTTLPNLSLPYAEMGQPQLSSRHLSLNNLDPTLTSDNLHMAPSLGRVPPYLPHPSQLGQARPLPIPSIFSLPPPDWESSNTYSNTHTSNTSTHSKNVSSTISVQSLIIPQNDGTSDEIQEQATNKSEKLSETKRVDELIRQKVQAIPQLEGHSDRSSPPSSPRGGDELGSEDDDTEEEEPETDHLILCLFEKVSRNKNKRKCNMKDGVMHLNGKDILFHKATGEFEF